MKRFFAFLVLVACIMSGCNKDNESPEMTIGNITVSDKNEMNQRLYADRNQSRIRIYRRAVLAPPSPKPAPKQPTPRRPRTGSN